MNKQQFSLKRRLKSFTYAINGLKILVKEEHNARIHLLVATVVTFLGFYLGISSLEWIALIFSIAMVFVLEIINTSIENIADFFSPEKHPQIKIIKDLAAAGVLVGAISSIFIGLLIFLPRFFA